MLNNMLGDSERTMLIIDKRSVLDFDWSSDIATANTPLDKSSKPIPDTSKEISFNNYYEEYALAQADPGDIFFYSENRKTLSVNPHYYIWKNTFDSYINAYIHLLYQIRNNPTESFGREIVFPETIEEKYTAYLNTTHKRKKTLSIDPPHCKATENNSSEGTYVFLFPQVGTAAYANQFCRSLYTPPNATTKTLYPQYDGTLFPHKKAAYHFEFEDYYYHELLTGISLSIEIASVLMECKIKFNEPDIWNKAIRDFSKKALPTIVWSSCLYTRNSVARLFFQQIFMELTLQKYRWPASFSALDNADCWNDLIERASSSISILEANDAYIPVEDSRADDALAHIKDLFASVDKSWDLLSYALTPTRGLAAFCNEKHEHVTYYLSEINPDRYNDHRKNRKTDRYRGEKDIIFQTVHKEVRRAIKFCQTIRYYQDMHQCCEIYIFDQITDDVLQVYSKFASTNGGLILLLRRLAYKYDKRWEPQNKTIERLHIWRRGADDLVEDFWCATHVPGYTVKSSLKKEDIDVREKAGYEIISIPVPGKNTKSIPKQKNSLGIYVPASFVPFKNIREG